MNPKVLRAMKNLLNPYNKDTKNNVKQAKQDTEVSKNTMVAADERIAEVEFRNFSRAWNYPDMEL